MKLIIALLLFASIHAFNNAAVPFRPTVIVRQTRELRSSPLDDDDLPDEVARLIAKGRAIRQNVDQAQENNDVAEEEMVEIIEWTDLDKLPEFKTKVPEKTPTTDQTQDTPLTLRKKKKKQDDEQPLAPDYTLDYSDENELHIPNRIGFTTGSWGDASRGFVMDGKLTNKMKKEGKFLPGDAQVAYNTMLSAGITFCVSSEIHGKASRGRLLSAEHIVGKCMDENSEIAPIISTTYDGSFKHMLTNGFRVAGVVKALQQSCQRMETTSVELFQAKNSFSKRVLAKGLADAVDRGLCNYVGVVDMNRGELKAMVKKLDELDCALTSNQFEFSLTNRKNMALIDVCKALKVIPLIRNPLGDGDLASGRYTATNPTGQGGGRPKFSFKLLDSLSPLHSVQEMVAERVSSRVRREQKDLKGRSKSRFPPPEVNTSISTTQVAINYVIAKGGVPLVDVYNTKSAEEVKGCLGWALTDDEVDLLDKAASLCGL